MPYLPQYTAEQIRSSLGKSTVNNFGGKTFIPRDQLLQIRSKLNEDGFSDNQVVSMLKSQNYILDGLEEYESDIKRNVVSSAKARSLVNYESKKEDVAKSGVVGRIQDRAMRSKDIKQLKEEESAANPDLAQKAVKFAAEDLGLAGGVRSIASLPKNLLGTFGLKDTVAYDLAKKPLDDFENQLQSIGIEKNFQQGAVELATDIGVSALTGKLLMKGIMGLPSASGLAARSPQLAKYTAGILRGAVETEAATIAIDERHAKWREFLLGSMFETGGVAISSAINAARKAQLGEQLVNSLGKIDEKTWSSLFEIESKAAQDVRLPSALDAVANTMRSEKERLIDKPLQLLGNQIGKVKEQLRTLKGVVKIDTKGAIDNLNAIIKKEYGDIIKYGDEGAKIFSTEGSVASLTSNGKSIERNIIMEMYNNIKKASTPYDIVKIFDDANDNYRALSKSNNLPTSKRFTSIIAQIRSPLDDQLAGVIGDGYKALRDDFHRLKNLQTDFETIILKKIPKLGDTTTTIGPLKKLFSPSKNDVIELFEDFEKFSGSNFIDKARVAKGLADMFDNQRIKSLLETTAESKTGLINAVVSRVRQAIIGSPKSFAKSFVGQLKEYPRSTYIANYIDDISNKVSSLIKDDMDIKTASELMVNEVQRSVDNSFDEFVTGLRGLSDDPIKKGATSIDDTKELNKILNKAAKESGLDKFVKQAHDIEELDKVAGKSAEAATKRERLIEQLAEENNIDQFEASDMYDDLLNMREKLYKVSPQAFDNTQGMRTSTTSNPMQVRGVSQVSDDLLKEAKKYKSADEFIDNARGLLREKFYKSNTVEDSYGNVYHSDNELDEAKRLVDSGKYNESNRRSHSEAEAFDNYGDFKDSLMADYEELDRLSGELFEKRVKYIEKLPISQGEVSLIVNNVRTNGTAWKRAIDTILEGDNEGYQSIMRSIEGASNRHGETMYDFVRGEARGLSEEAYRAYRREFNAPVDAEYTSIDSSIRKIREEANK